MFSIAWAPFFATWRDTREALQFNRRDKLNMARPCRAIVHRYPWREGHETHHSTTSDFRKEKCVNI
jgi:hypothetical protein